MSTVMTTPLPHPTVANFPTGVSMLRDPALNKGLAFTEEEREKLGLLGLLPPHIQTQDEQVVKVMENLRRKTSDLEKYIYMSTLQERNECLFYRVVLDHLEELIPILYTPTVGLACQEYGHIFRRPHGLFLSAKYRDRLKELLEEWPYDNVRMIVVTDGERILGLGDIGAGCMGIPVAKLALYTACAGIPSSACLPITLDVGTDNQVLLNDPLYIGLRQPRLRGRAYDEFIEEFIKAVQQTFPHAVVQFENFGNRNAFRLLQQYRNKICSFNDDIQGTGAVVLAGLYAALRLIDGTLKDQKILFLGAGEAATGIAEAIVAAMVAEGSSYEVARQRCWLVDSSGLVVKSRSGLTDHKRPYAHRHKPLPNLAAAIKKLRPSILIGASGKPDAFSRPILESMAYYNRRPVVFALSNPASKSECTAAQAYIWTQGRAIFASGSPVCPVIVRGRTFVPSQANNVYIFPGIGLGAMVSGARRINNAMLLVAARTLSCEVSDADLAKGCVYPRLENIRDISAAIAAAVATIAYVQGLGDISVPADDLKAVIKHQMYKPRYPSYA